MNKRFKLRLSFPSFQLCRLKHPNSFPHTPFPAVTYRFSPINPKSFEISFPPGIPEPPPSTPNFPLSKRHVSSPPAKIMPVDCGECRSRSRSQSQYNSSKRDNTKSSPQYNCEEHHSTRPARVLEGEKKEKENNKKKTKASVCISSSTADRVWFSTEGSDYYNEETESLISFSRSFDSSYDFDYSLETITESPKKKKNNFNVRGLKHCGSKSWKGGERTTKTTTPENVSRARTTEVDGKVKESFAVVKRSEDPYEDFKRSMLEMILEKDMVDAEDLEQLLQCFLSLNSRHHHAAIVEAFAEVWEVLFCESPDSRRVSMDH